MKYYISIIIFVYQSFYDSYNCYERIPSKVVDFSYDIDDKKHGPLNWSKIYPNCDGQNQSPINIDLNNVIQLVEPNYNRLRIDNYHEIPENIIIRNNNGHTVKYEFKWNNIEKIPSIKGGILNDEYVFADLHIHWGAFFRKGSEHSINSKRFDTEFHLVFYNKKYCYLANAKTKANGLVIFGIFGELFGPSTTNIVISKLDKHNSLLKQITVPDDFIKMPEQFSLSDVFGYNVFEEYYIYNGSITTPPCYESVTWIVSGIPIQITRSQLTVFHYLKSKYGDLNSNVRQLQKLNDRTIYSFLNY